MTAPLAGKTILMSGGSRGIGLAIALRAAADGANIALLAKTDVPDPRLPGTIHTAAEEIRAAGGNALAIVGDVRNDDDITEALSLDLAVSGVAIGDLVTLLDDDVPVAEQVATATTLTITDPAPAVGATHLYSVTVNGAVDGSAGWSVAVLNGLFVDGFEDPPPPP